MHYNFARQHSTYKFLKQFLGWGILIFIIFSSHRIEAADSTAVNSSGINLSYVRQLRKELKATKVAILYAEDAVQTISDSSHLPDLLFHLSELEIRRAKLQFELDMIKFDLRNKLFEMGKIKKAPAEPKISFIRAIGINQQILESFPNVPFKADLLYRTAICFYESGNKDKAKELFLELIPLLHSPKQLNEVIFRLGECYFAEQDYQKALTSYNRILKSWDSPFFAMALYKIAWCHYLTNRIPDAISTFYYLLKDIHLLENMDTELLGKSQVELRDEVLQYIALSFSDFGGTRSLLKFISENGETEYIPNLLHKLGKIFFKRDFYEDALQALTYVKENFASYDDLPHVYKLLFDNYDRMGLSKKKIAIRDEYVRNCGGAGDWHLAHQGKEYRQTYTDVLKEIDKQLATPFLAAADSLFALEKYALARPRYQKFLQAFPKDDRCDHAQFCIAECAFNLGEFAQAEKEYQKIIDDYPKSELFEEAAYDQVLCYDHLAKNVPSDQLPIALITACEKFIERVPNSDRTVEIELKLAEIYFQKDFYKESEKWTNAALRSILKYGRGKGFRSNAIHLLAQTKFRQKEYIQAARLFARLKQENPDSLQLVDFCNSMIASCQFKNGEKLKSSGKLDEAAHSFELTALQSADEKIAKAALFEAAKQYEKIGKYLKAAVNFESFFNRFASSKETAEALYRAASLREKLGQFHLAAMDYYHLYQTIGDSEKGAAALFNAGLAMEKAKDWLAMHNFFTEYANKFDHNPDKLLQAMYKIGYASEQQKLFARAEREYMNLIDKHLELAATGEEVNNESAAQAAFQLAEISHQYFRGIKLVPPFEIQLKRKKQAFSDMLKKYVEVTRFNMGEWTTAAFYQIGLAYEEFCQDILNSPPPVGLSDQQKKAYWATIEQQLVIPLQLEALKYYQTNLQISMQHSIQNTWTQRTRDQLMLLKQTLSRKNALPPQEQIKRAGNEMLPRETTNRRTL